MLASIIYSHIAINYEEDESINRLVSLFQLLVTFDCKIVQQSIQNLTLDFGQIGSFRGAVDVTDLDQKWTWYAEEEETRMFTEDLNDFNLLLEKLAEKLRNLALVSPNGPLHSLTEKSR